MADPSLDLRLFRYALAAAEHGSFRRAAAMLNVQQSSVSRGIRNLEHRLGIELFERDHAGIRPTPAGDRFLEEATRGIDHLTRATQRVVALKRGEHGDLAIGISVPFAVVAGVIERFRAAYSGVFVECVENTTEACCSAVRHRQVDVAFVAKTRADGASRSFALHDESMTVVLPSSHRLASARAVRLEELHPERLILSTGGLGPDIEDHLVRRMSKTGGHPDIQWQRVSQCSIINMVAHGFGATVVVGPHPCAEAEAVALVPLAGRSVVSVHAVWMECNPNPALRNLLNIVRKSARSGPAP